MRKHPLPLSLFAVSIAMCAVATWAGVHGMTAIYSVQSAESKVIVPPELPLLHPMIGVAGQDVSVWNKTTQVSASLSVSYISMAKPVPKAFMKWIEVGADGARPVIEILPRGYTLQSIVSGTADGWFRSLKAEINEKVVIAFAPEANGNWYTWGQQPKLFRKAWQHVWSIIGTDKVTWLWQMSARVGLTAYWPGGRYVTWAGLDGYFETPSSTFVNVFGGAIKSIRSVAKVPMILSETAVGPLTGNVSRDIQRLFVGASRSRITGVIYFDRTQDAPPRHQNWLLTANKGALAAFRNAAISYEHSSQGNCSSLCEWLSNPEAWFPG